jgi:hypothetical protein
MASACQYGGLPRELTINGRRRPQDIGGQQALYIPIYERFIRFSCADLLDELLSLSSVETSVAEAREIFNTDDIYYCAKST